MKDSISEENHYNVFSKHKKNAQNYFIYKHTCMQYNNRTKTKYRCTHIFKWCGSEFGRFSCWFNFSLQIQFCFKYYSCNLNQWSFSLAFLFFIFFLVFFLSRIILSFITGVLFFHVGQEILQLVWFFNKNVLFEFLNCFCSISMRFLETICIVYKQFRILNTTEQSWTWELILACRRNDYCCHTVSDGHTIITNWNQNDELFVLWEVRIL